MIPHNQNELRALKMSYFEADDRLHCDWYIIVGWQPVDKPVDNSMQPLIAGGSTLILDHQVFTEDSVSDCHLLSTETNKVLVYGQWLDRTTALADLKLQYHARKLR